MSGQPIHGAREAAKALVRQLSPEDRIAVVTFETQAEVVVPSTLARNTALLEQTIDGIDIRGRTALFDGWGLAAMKVSRHLKQDALNRVVLLSDGCANVGLRKPDEIAGHVQELARRGVSTSTYGLSDHYDEVLLETMSIAGDGNYAYVEHLQQLTPLFDAELSGLQSTHGRLTSLGIEPNGELDITIADVLNDYRRTETGRLKLPNLIAGTPVETIIKVHVSGKSALQPGDTASLLRIRLAWTDTGSGERRVLRTSLKLPVLSASEVQSLPEDADVKDKITSLRIAREKDESTRSIDRGDYPAAYESVRRARQLSLNLAGFETSSRESGELDDIESSLQSNEYAKARKLASSQSHTRKRKG
ncbi:vWA domain-containing protein [Deinococcus peraridilitoris]|uniref:vWA domain-containing protein n=1 Tax=Deinococcus peraridilitoris TaxID=432329 RepID=UPI0002D5754E|nr:VWA domain-containing protein [Deinococcus peraridilitoris]